MMIHNHTLQLGEPCPPDLDPQLFDKVISTYWRLSESCGGPPILETVVEHVEDFHRLETYKELNAKMLSDFKIGIIDIFFNDGKYAIYDRKSSKARTEQEVEKIAPIISELATETAFEAVSYVSGDILSDVFSILVRQKLVFRSISMVTSNSNGLINSPQTIIDLREGKHEHDDTTMFGD